MSDAERCVVCGEVIQEWALEDAVKKPNAFSKAPEENDEFWNAAVSASYGKEFDGMGRRKEDAEIH